MYMQQIIVHYQLEEQFNKITQNLKVSNESTRAYIFGIFKNKLINNNDLSKDSITIKYAEAKFSYDFEKFQILGDWIFFTKSIFPKSLNRASPEYYDAIAQNSYYRCYKILDKKWILFEELADEFTNLTNTIQQYDLLKIP